MSKYVATYRMVFDAHDDSDAVIISDAMLRAIGDRLDSDDGDTVELVECISFGLTETMAGAADTLRKARNLLLRTRVRDFYYLAEELDKAAYALEKGIDPSLGYPGYDWGRLTDIAALVLKGKMPVG